jgi:hypothetical protein
VYDAKPDKNKQRNIGEGVKEEYKKKFFWIESIFWKMQGCD